MHLKTDTELQNGKYRIERVLGQGGFGMVYLADDTFLKRKVAIKEFFLKSYCSRSDSDGTIVTTGQASGEIVGKMKAKFLKEARHIARFNHPGIIKIHDAFEENGTAYYVMDFIEGESLQEMVKRNGPLSQKKAVEYISKVGDAIQYIHDRHVNHLDVKPSNILVRAEDDQPILIDFGLSKQYDSSGEQTSTTPVGISHGYAPIEQYVEGGIREFSPPTDVYSLAATLYYLLEGVKPLNHSEIIAQGFPAFKADIPAPTRQAIEHAMMPRKLDRPESIAQFLAELPQAATYPAQKKNSGSHVELTIPITEESIQEAPNDPGETSRQKDVSTADTVNSDAHQAKGTVIAASSSTQSGSANNYDKIRKAKQRQRNEILGWFVLISIVGIVIYLQNSESTSQSNYVTNAELQNAFGNYAYTGEVDENGLPNGNGKATYSSGQINTYDGKWVHGYMDGTGKMHLKNSDYYEGSFYEDHFFYGTYTFNENGNSFKGSFKILGDDRVAQPYNGTVYNKAGIKIQKLVSGDIIPTEVEDSIAHEENYYLADTFYAPLPTAIWKNRRFI